MPIDGGVRFVSAAMKCASSLRYDSAYRSRKKYSSGSTRMPDLSCRSSVVARRFPETSMPRSPNASIR